MAKQLQLRKGATTEHNTFTGAVGEVTVDISKDVLVVHDGDTVGGHPVAAKANSDGTISLIKKDGTSAGTINALGLFNNTLTSTNTNQALTAAQGKVLKDLAETKLDKTSAFGVGQTYQDVRGSRATNTTYTNSTGKLIFISIGTFADNHTNLDVVINGVTAGYVDARSGWEGARTTTFPIPVGATYRVNGENGQVNTWTEMR